MRVVELLVALVLAGRAVEGQRPERPQEVQVPGIEFALKVGWQLLFVDGCRVAVPVSWRLNPDASQIFAPDGSNLSLRMHVGSWSLHKSQARASFGQVRSVREDSDRRLWIEVGDDKRSRHYIAVTNGSSACGGLLEIRDSTPNAAETTNIIAGSIGAAPTQWPPHLK